MTFGQLAREHGQRLPLQILRSAAGYYLGTADDEGPCTRESVEYWPNQARAQAALDTGNWTQRPYL